MNYSAYAQELTRLMIVYAVEFGALVIAFALSFWSRTKKYGRRMMRITPRARNEKYGLEIICV